MSARNRNRGPRFWTFQPGKKKIFRDPPLIETDYKQKQFFLAAKEQEAKRGQVIASSADIQARKIRLAKDGDIKTTNADTGKILARFTSES